MENILSNVLDDVVIFTSKQCAKCMALKDMLSQSNINNIKMVDIDHVTPEELQKYKIRTLPTTVLFKNGDAIDVIVDLAPRSEYIAKINNVYGSI